MQERIARKIVFEIIDEIFKSPHPKSKLKNKEKDKNRKDQRKKISPIFKSNRAIKDDWRVKRLCINLVDDSKSCASNSYPASKSARPRFKKDASPITSVWPSLNGEDHFSSYQDNIHSELDYNNYDENYYDNYEEEYEQYEEENKEQSMFNFDDNYQRNPRYSCKSVQNTMWNNSPFKPKGKGRSRIYSKSKPFQPNYAKEESQSNFSNTNYDQSPWQGDQDLSSALNFNNLLENGCFQLLNEKLNAFATGRFERPSKNPRYFYGAPNNPLSENKSQSVSSSIPHSENGYLAFGGIENSESSDCKLSKNS